jgi:GxxExxY protein
MAQHLRENEVSGIIVDAAMYIHRTLGPGLLESVYEAILKHELEKRGLKVERQVPVAVHWEDVHIDVGFRADLIVESLVVVELKSVEKIVNVHKKQLLTYLRLTDLRLGLVLNFGADLMKDGIARVANGLQE